jgi:glycosyltransferase involved in cell wall biosynthesis
MGFIHPFSRIADAPMTQFTAAIRTYNGADRLPLLLDQLRGQIEVDGLDWEVVIIDNNSTDDTANVILAYQQTWSAPMPVRYIFEPQQGAATARRRAIQESRGTLIGFLDDDNVPAENWVAAAIAFGQTHPQAGAYSSQIHGDFEVAPPPNFHRIALYLPVAERKTGFQFNTQKKGLPPGAGIVIRRQAWLDSVPAVLLLQGPVKSSLMIKGEDLEALYHIRKTGWEIWHNPEMHIHHRIPHWRLERNYLISFCRGIGLIRHRTRMFGYPTWQQPIVTPIYLIKDLWTAILYYLKNRQLAKTDTVTACELEMLFSNCVSPFYIGNMLLRQNVKTMQAKLKMIPKKESGKFIGER